MTKSSKILYFIILSTCVFQIIKFYSFYSEYSSWQYVEWLMNYQGGFVRRGLPGEFLYQIHQFLGIKLDLLILVTVCTIYFCISFFLYKSVKYIQLSYINILIFLSPGFFLYPIMNSEIIGRKDILFILVIGFFVFFEKKFKNNIIVFFISIGIFILCLSHSAFLFYAPYLIFLFFLIKIKKKSEVKFYELFFLLLTTIVVFFLIFYNQGNANIVSNICESVKNFVSPNCETAGQLYWLGNDAKSHISVQAVKLDHFIIYTFSLIVVYFFIGLKFYKSKFKITKFNLDKFNPILILILLFVITSPVYYLGSDWGRYIFISYSGSFFLYIYCIKENLISSNYDLKINKFFFSVLIIFYSFFWTFPFYHAEKIKITIKKPLLQILKFK